MSELAAPEPRARKRPLRWLWFLVILLALAGGGVWWVQRQLAPTDPDGQAAEFEVLPGWGASRIASELEARGLVQNARVFGLYLRVQGLDRDLGEGLYRLSPSLSTPEIAERLADGGSLRVVTVTIPEGFRAGQVTERLAGRGLGDVETFRQLIENPGALRPTFVPAGAGLEGYLFPASYEFPAQGAPEGVLRVMLRRFERELTPEVRARLENLGLSVHGWVTLASLIQAEAGSHSEMPLIAGVFLNRLDREMPLQSDPTVAYGLGKRLPDLDASAGDLQADHPWNTYTRVGLPKGPIGNPGRAALRVVLRAQRTDASGEPFLYFLHGRGGEFRPNLTLEGHNRDVEEFLR